MAIKVLYTATQWQLGDGTVTHNLMMGFISVKFNLFLKRWEVLGKRCYNNPGTLVCRGIRCLFWKRV